METGIHELTAAYALDALEPEEREAYEAHLAGCDSCREELASFGPTTEALALAASGPTPPAELRERILEAARAEPQTVVPFVPRRARVAPILWVATAAAAVVAVSLGVWAVHLSNSLDLTRTALARQRQAVAVLADPTAQTVRLKAGAGRLVVDANGRAALVLAGLEQAPSGKTYETWIINRGTPVPAGVFPGGKALDVVGVDGVVGQGDVVAVTIERSGGARKPTSAPIVASSPV
jgi:anti-sigma-K factor RskA